jgi:hypothetical protein
MNRTTAALVATFVVLEALAALVMAAMSVHGPDALPIAAGAYFVIAAGLTWWAGRRMASALRFAGVGLALLAAAPAVVAVVIKAEEVAYQRRIAATRVDDVRDEPILGVSGRPIGVRVSYRVTAPKRGYFWILPSLYSQAKQGNRGIMSTGRWTIDGSSEPRPFERGRTHVMVVELYPSLLFFGREGRCLSVPVGLPVPDVMPAAPLRLAISETTFGDSYRDGTEQVTRGAYDIGKLYQGVLAEGLQNCRQP